MKLKNPLAELYVPDSFLIIQTAHNPMAAFPSEAQQNQDEQSAYSSRISFETQRICSLTSNDSHIA